MSLNQSASNTLNAEDVMDVVNILADDTITQMKTFDNKISNFLKDFYEEELLQKTNLVRIKDNLLDETNSVINKAREDCDKNKEYLCKLELEIAELKLKEQLEQTNLNNAHNERCNLETNIAVIKQKHQRLQELKDVIQTCKLLTNTEFVYDDQNVKGYACGEINEIKTFNLDPIKVPQSEVPNALWELVAEMNLKLK